MQKIYIKNVIFKHARSYGCGSWLPEDKKDNMWHESEKCSGLWPHTFPRSYTGPFYVILEIQGASRPSF